MSIGDDPHFSSVKQVAHNRLGGMMLAGLALTGLAV